MAQSADDTQLVKDDSTGEDHGLTEQGEQAFNEGKYGEKLSDRDKITIEFIGRCLKKIFWSDVKLASETFLLMLCVLVSCMIVVKWGCYTDSLIETSQGVVINKSSSIAIDAAIDIILVLLFLLISVLAIRIFCIGNVVGKIIRLPKAIIEYSIGHKCIVALTGLVVGGIIFAYFYFAIHQEYNIGLPSFFSNFEITASSCNF